MNCTNPGKGSRPVSARKLLLSVLGSLLFCPTAPLRCSYPGPRISAENALFTRPVAKRSGRDAGASRAGQQSTNFFEAADFFVNGSN